MPGSGRSTCSGDCTEPQKKETSHTRDIPCLINTNFAKTMSIFFFIFIYEILYYSVCCYCAKFHFLKHFEQFINKYSANLEHPVISLIGMSC